MIGGLRVAVVVPAFRVAREIGAVLDAMPRSVDRVLVVDDASPDDVSGVVTARGEERVTVLRHAANQGVGAATITGFRAALDQRFDVVVKCDGDGQMDPSQIPRLVEPLARGIADYSKGCRFHHPRELASMPRSRLIGNVGLTFLTKAASGYWNLVDPVNGFIAASADVIRRIPLAKISRRYFFESDLLIWLNVIGARIVDVPLPARYGDEPSSLSLTRSLFGFPPRLLRGLVRRYFWRYCFFDVSPVGVFAVLGAALTIFGGMLGVFEWVKNALAGIATPLGKIMLVTLPLIIGFQLLLQAVVLDIQNTPRPGRAERPPRTGDEDAFPDMGSETSGSAKELASVAPEMCDVSSGTKQESR